MATVETEVYDILRAASGVTSRCPATRIKTPGRNQNLALPYIIHFPVAERPTRTHGGLAALRIWDSYQVSVFSGNDPIAYGIGRARADAVRAAMDGVTSTGVHVQFRDMQHLFEDETQVNHFVLDFFIAGAL